MIFCIPIHCKGLTLQELQRLQPKQMSPVHQEQPLLCTIHSCLLKYVLLSEFKSWETSRPFLTWLTLLCVNGGAVYKVGWMSGRGRCGTVCKGTCPWIWGYRCSAGCVGFSGLRNWWPGGRAPAVIADAGSPEASCLQTWHSQVFGVCSA